MKRKLNAILLCILFYLLFGIPLPAKGFAAMTGVGWVFPVSPDGVIHNGNVEITHDGSYGQFTFVIDSIDGSSPANYLFDPNGHNHSYVTVPNGYTGGLIIEMMCMFNTTTAGSYFTGTMPDDFIYSPLLSWDTLNSGGYSYTNIPTSEFSEILYDDQGNPQFAAYPGGLNRNEVEVGFLGSQGFDWHQYYFYVKPKPGHTFSNLNQWYISTNVSSMEHDSQGGFIIRTAVGHYTIVSTVPEPATFSILIFGVLALLYRRK